MDKPAAPSLDVTSMDAVNIIALASDHGVTLKADGERIKANPGDKLTSALRDAIRDHYADILELLARDALLEQVVYPTLRDPNTGAVVPNLMALAEPLPGGKIRARLGSYTIAAKAEVVQLVDIFAPAEGKNSDGETGMKGLTFRVVQLPELLRALHKVYIEAVKHKLISDELK
ncbi:MAG TPA: hypothetical protein VKB96_18325 [Gammaproteobacteria bacterium]|nr:hypothetical protein [Gammaproteobacteria bacterium]